MPILPLDAARDGDVLRPLLAACAPVAYGSHASLVCPDRLRSFSHERVSALLRDEGTSGFVLYIGAPVGVAAWRGLSWDSRLFGFPAARLDLLCAEGEYDAARERKAGLLAALLEDCRARGVRHLVTRIDAGDLSSIHALEGAGFEMLDGIQTFSLELGGAPDRVAPSGFAVREFRSEDLDQVLVIARGSYTQDRFHADRALTAEIADAVNQEWLRNSCVGTAADVVIVAVRGGEVLGYVTAKIDRETRTGLGISFAAIVMVATKAGARRLGVARALTMEALQWLRERDVGVVEVGTQLRNLAAGRLYESCGFRLAGVSLTFRKLLS